MLRPFEQGAAHAHSLSSQIHCQAVREYVRAFARALLRLGVFRNGAGERRSCRHAEERHR